MASPQSGSRRGRTLGLALLLALPLSLASGGCDRSKLPYFGQLGEPCYPNGTCAVGLVCSANRCHRRGEAGPPPPDTRPPPDQATDAPVKCWPPGSPCVSADLCTIKAACGPSGTCQLLERLDCNDGLACTDDRCTSSTSCRNEPRNGLCAIEVQEGGKLVRRCFKAGDKRPDTTCLVCDPKVSNTQWAPANVGTGCDDGDDCTKDDRCSAGKCTGTFYGNSCADKLGCTKDGCDGKGGCIEPSIDADACVIADTCYKKDDLGSADGKTCGACEPGKSQSAWTPLAASCHIGGTCYREKDKHPKGCASCAPATASDAWTVDADSCLIGDVCAKSGALGPALCSTCDPKVDPLAWSPLTNRCQLDGECLKDQDKHPSGCLVCDPKVDAKGWSPVAATTTVLAEGFDGALTLPSGWSETHTDPANKVRWQVVATSTAKGPPNTLYYGDPATKSYRTGNVKNGGKASWKGIELAATGKAGLRAFVWMDLENSNAYDRVIIRLIDGTKTSVLWQKPAGQSTLRKWVTIDVDLTAWAGQKGLEIEIEFDSVDHLNNTTEGVYLDQLTIYSGC